MHPNVKRGCSYNSNRQLTSYTLSHTFSYSLCPPLSDESSKAVFPQLATQVLQKSPPDLRCSTRAWKVNLAGEGADDAGGVFDEIITQMCEVINIVCRALML